MNRILRKEAVFMSNIVYKSVLAPYMNELLAMKRAQGMDSTTLGWLFNDLDKYALHVGLRIRL